MKNSVPSLLCLPFVSSDLCLLVSPSDVDGPPFAVPRESPAVETRSMTR